MKPGDSLVSTISMPKGLVLARAVAATTIERGVDDSSPIRTAAVLTCVAEPQPPDAFRPAFCDRQQKIYLARNLKRDCCPRRPPPEACPRSSEYIRFTQRPWVGTCFFGFEEPVENMPQYGREYGRVAGISALLLCTDLKPEQKEPLLVNFVQVGIDLGGMVRAGHPGWTGLGGHGSGRKLPIVFAGLLLGDDELANVNKSFPKVSFGEDEQTAYGDCWTGAKVVFAGHSASTRPRASAAARGNAWGPYEHTPPSQWRTGQNTSESYRRCCTSVGLGRPGAGPPAHARRESLEPRRLLGLCGPLDVRERRQFVKTIKPATGRTRQAIGRGKARPGTPSSTRCGPGTGRRSRPRATAGSSSTTTVTTARPSRSCPSRRRNGGRRLGRKVFCKGKGEIRVGHAPLLCLQYILHTAATAPLESRL